MNRQQGVIDEDNAGKLSHPTNPDEQIDRAGMRSGASANRPGEAGKQNTKQPAPSGQKPRQEGGCGCGCG